MFEYSKYSIIHEIYIRWREFEMGYYWLGCLKKRNVLKVWRHFANCDEFPTPAIGKPRDINFTILGDASSLMFMH